MRHPVLTGEFELNVDEKNRLLIPSEVRKSINQQEHGDGFFLVMGINRRPWLYSERYYENLVTAGPADITPEQDLLAFDQLHFALASRVEPDGQGRLVLPQKILRRAGIQKEVTLIGVRDHLEIWNRSDWDARIMELEQKSAEIAIAAKRQRRQLEPERSAERTPEREAKPG